MDLLGYFHKMDAALQNSTRIEINESLDVCLCHAHFTNQDEKRVRVSLGFEISDTDLNRTETLKLIEVLKKLVKEL